MSKKSWHISQELNCHGFQAVGLMGEFGFPVPIGYI
jgi:hypothetical protein